MSGVSEMWDGLSAKHKRVIALGSAAGILGVMLLLLLSSNQPSTRIVHEQPELRTLLTGRNTDGLAVDALSGQLAIMRDEFGKMKRERELEISRSNDRMATLRQHFEDRSTRQQSEFEQRLERMRREMEVSQARLSSSLEMRAGKNEDGVDGEDGMLVVEPSQSDWESMLRQAETESTNVISSGIDSGNSSRTQVDTGLREPREKGSIQVYEEIPDVSAGKTAKPEDELAAILSSGGIVSGTLLTGLDAPTGVQSRRDPFPVLLRVKHEAILPNRFSLDIKECFLVASGFGDLSSERAYLRGERLSCLTDDGRTIDVNIDAYSVGEDGKNGVRGRVVSRNGRMIAMSMLAGFGSGLSDIFRPAAITNLNTSPDRDVIFQKPDTKQALEAGAYSGLSNALSRIADYWLEMAENIFPVIEIDAGRQITFVILKGVKLTVEK